MATYTIEQANMLIAQRRAKLEEESRQSRRVDSEHLRRKELEKLGALERKKRTRFEAGLWKVRAELSKEIRAIWWSMLNRCKHDPHYQGRIKVCPRWERLDSFWADMGDRPSPRHSIGRIDNEKNYEPGNCRWELAYQQAGNRRTLRKTISGVQGVSWDKTRGVWVASGMHKGVLQKLYRGEDFEQAVLCRKAWEKMVLGRG